jgi:hypothetical protein
MNIPFSISYFLQSNCLAYILLIFVTNIPQQRAGYHLVLKKYNEQCASGHRHCPSPRQSQICAAGTPATLESTQMEWTKSRKQTWLHTGGHIACTRRLTCTNALGILSHTIEKSVA